MKEVNKYTHLILAYIFKLMFSFILTNSLVISLFYTLINVSLYLILIKDKKRISNFVCFSMIDYLLVYGIIYINHGMNLIWLAISIIGYAINNLFLYPIIIKRLARDNTAKVMSINAIKNIDKGIKALDDENYNEALLHFQEAIREHKNNYLGYMGMCNTLSKMDRKNLRKFNYYKKKCIKYAPKELKESIIDKCQRL